MLELELVHELLVDAGMPAEEVHIRFPEVPLALAEDFHPWRPEQVGEVRSFVSEYLDALNASIPQAHLMEALDRGIFPEVATRVWTMNRSVDDFRTVLAYTQACARLSLRLGDHPDHIDATCDRAAADAWAWLDSDIPVTRITTYIRAGVALPEAATQHEPLIASPETLESLEMLAALRADLRLEDEVEWSLD